MEHKTTVKVTSDELEQDMLSSLKFINESKVVILTGGLLTSPFGDNDDFIICD